MCIGIELSARVRRLRYRWEYEHLRKDTYASSREEEPEDSSLVQMHQAKLESCLEAGGQRNLDIERLEEAPCPESEDASTSICGQEISDHPRGPLEGLAEPLSMQRPTVSL
jgi:hypothetical protein